MSANPHELPPSNSSGPSRRFPASETRPDEITIHPCNEVETDLFRARRIARAATDARRGVEREIRVFLRDQNRIRVGRRARGRADEAANLDDPVEGAPIHNQILDDRERLSAPGLDREV